MAQDLNNKLDTKINKRTEIWIILMRIGAIGCHQIYERSFSFRGYQFPVCARCTGIFIGNLIAIFLSIIEIRINLSICVLFIFIMACDAFLQLFKIKKSTNARRLISGILAGVGYIFMLVNIVSYFLKHLLL